MRIRKCIENIFTVYYFKSYNYKLKYVNVCILVKESSRHTNINVNHKIVYSCCGDWVKILLAFRERLPCVGIQMIGWGKTQKRKRITIRGFQIVDKIFLILFEPFVWGKTMLKGKKAAIRCG